MDYESYISIDREQQETGLLRPEPEKLGANADRRFTSADADLGRHVALVESRTFMRECMHRGMQAALPLPVLAFSTLSELVSQFSNAVALVFLCLPDARPAECSNALKVLSDLAPGVPVVVLATANDMELAKTAVSFGAKGFLPSATDFEIAIEAVRFILAGGSYIPMDYLLASGAASVPARQTSEFVLTDREISVVKAIVQGKSNKVIAYQLCMCEGTVKVHLRNIMKKMKAKNRTDVAIKAQSSLALETERAGL
jgi:DNA-binding NarL/FixJ family response regulator